MPFLGLGLHIGDSDPDRIIGPPRDGALRAESGAYLIIEAGNYLLFD